MRPVHRALLALCAITLMLWLLWAALLMGQM